MTAIQTIIVIELTFKILLHLMEGKEKLILSYNIST